MYQIIKKSYFLYFFNSLDININEKYCEKYTRYKKILLSFSYGFNIKTYHKKYNYYKKQPLSIAIRKKCYNYVWILLNNGDNPYKIFYNHTSPLYYYYINNITLKNLSKLIKKYNINIKRLATRINNSYNNSTTLLFDIINYGYDENNYGYDENNSYQNYFIRNIIKYDNDIVNYSLSSNKNTPLHYAILNKKLILFKLLIIWGANIYKKNKNGKTVKDIAIIISDESPEYEKFINEYENNKNITI